MKRSRKPIKRKRAGFFGLFGIDSPDPIVHPWDGYIWKNNVEKRFRSNGAKRFYRRNRRYRKRARYGRQASITMSSVDLVLKQLYPSPKWPKNAAPQWLHECFVWSMR